MSSEEETLTTNSTTHMSGTAFPPIGLDRRSFVPYYRQIANQVKELIQSGGDCARSTVLIGRRNVS